MKRIMIIGCPGSGKSTLARALQAKTGLPLCHLDMLYWQENGEKVERELFLTRLDAVLKSDAWIIDGNFSNTIEERMKRCDTVIFLDLPADVCLAGVRARRGKKRPDIPWVETKEDPEFMAFIEHFGESRRPQILALMEAYPEKTRIHLTSHAQIDAFLEALAPNN